jgi:methylmalonyl-CoA/ethylmalonyl-CoA epimerase
MNMLEKVDHIAIAVNNLQEGLFLYETLFGLHFLGRETIEEQGVEAAKLSLGDCIVELLSPLSSESPIAKFLRKRGQGIHHIALKAEKLEETIEELRKKGFRFTTETPTRGAGGSQIIFIHPQSTLNVLFELTTGHKNSC